MAYIDVQGLFDGPGLEFPTDNEWERSDSLLTEYGIKPVERRHPDASDEGLASFLAGKPTNRAYLRSHMRRRLVKAGHQVDGGEGI
jgi:hypothetical protein